MRTIKIVRERGYYGMWRALDLVVDGNVVGRIRAGQTIAIKVSEHAEKILGQMDWGKTMAISLRGLGNQGVVVFTPYFTFNILRNIGIMQLPIRVACRP